MSKLFTPLTLRNLTLPNRIVVSPMCQYSAVDGVAAEWHRVHYGALALGGAGTVIVEATAVAPEGRITPFDLGLWSPSQADALAPVARFIRAQGAVAAIQLGHAGRKASCAAPWDGGASVGTAQGGWQPAAPSALAFTPQHPVPTELDRDAIGSIAAKFAAAAQRALDAGFQVAEVHMAHGYLLHQFLSPLTNRRGDDYGGSLDNRLRLPLAVVRSVREVWPVELPVWVRISATDWVDGGWDLAQSVQLARRLKDAGVDLIDVSAGGLIADAPMPAAPGFQTPFAAAIREQAAIPTGTVGLITAPAQAEHILVGGEADAVFLGRELLRNPRWPQSAARELGADLPWPRQYQRAKI